MTMRNREIADRLLNWLDLAEQTVARLEASKAPSPPIILRGINDLAAHVHQVALDKHWWDSSRSVNELLMLCVSELSEAYVAYRNRKMEVWDNNGKPEGFEVELADTIIRILDICAALDIDIEAAIQQKVEYNKTRTDR